MLFLWPMWEQAPLDVKNKDRVGCFGNGVIVIQKGIYTKWHVPMVGLEPGHCLALWRLECGSGTEVPFGFSWTILLLPGWLYVPMASYSSVSPLQSLQPNLPVLGPLLPLSAQPLPFDSWLLMPHSSCFLPPFL